VLLLEFRSLRVACFQLAAVPDNFFVFRNQYLKDLKLRVSNYHFSYTYFSGRSKTSFSKTAIHTWLRSPSNQYQPCVLIFWSVCHFSIIVSIWNIRFLSKFYQFCCGLSIWCYQLLILCNQYEGFEWSHDYDNFGWIASICLKIFCVFVSVRI
jgi:hypothetical protein